MGSNSGSSRSSTRRRLLPISTLILIMISVTVGTNLFLAAWIFPPLIVGVHNPQLDQGRGGSKTMCLGSTGNDGNYNAVNIYNNDEVIMSKKKALHIVTTRFQQHQPHLVEIGKARLKLFETFCLPTMIRQDVDDDFLWFIMTDPQLDSSLMQRLIDLLSPYPHFYLVTSNDKLLTPANLTRNDLVATDLIRTGDLDRLYTTMFDLHRPLLIETRLDADDGLHQSTLSEIQRMARYQLPVDTRGWQIICSRIHYEWRNQDILLAANTALSPVASSGTNMTTTAVVAAQNLPPSMLLLNSSGKIRLVRERICVTPGYTLVKHRPDHSIEFPHWPRTGHNLIVIEWPECRRPMFENDPDDNININNQTATFNCWTKLGNFPSALRSRTVTSAGMSRVESPPKETKYENQTQLFWTLVERDFGILESQALSTSRYMQQNLAHIVEDNLKGQWYVLGFVC